MWTWWYAVLIRNLGTCHVNISFRVYILKHIVARKEQEANKIVFTNLKQIHSALWKEKAPNIKIRQLYRQLRPNIDFELDDNRITQSKHAVLLVLKYLVKDLLLSLNLRINYINISERVGIQLRNDRKGQTTRVSCIVLYWPSASSLPMYELQSIHFRRQGESALQSQVLRLYLHYPVWWCNSTFFPSMCNDLNTQSIKSISIIFFHLLDIIWFFIITSFRSLLEDFRNVNLSLCLWYISTILIKCPLLGWILLLILDTRYKILWL